MNSLRSKLARQITPTHSRHWVQCGKAFASYMIPHGFSYVDNEGGSQSDDDYDPQGDGHLLCRDSILKTADPTSDDLIVNDKNGAKYVNITKTLKNIKGKRTIFNITFVCEAK